MPKRTTEEQLADAQQRLNQLREKSRKEKNRRKILVGAMYLSQAKQHNGMEKLLTRLDHWLPNGHRERRLWLDDGLGPIQGLYGNQKLQPPRNGWFAHSLSTKQTVQRFSFGDVHFRRVN
ncbi:hypothetical protein HLB35_16110 [Halomonas sp. TBZ9]|uniref:Uncharacterized protein n=1 Tax=Vreelandella azerica TaxID=2732867 RepID=A0A7Y3TZH7_9GAMM|nr:hypothetical protein [Halomonas azerica]NOG32913.1 hypothetical protein [Halomonas azerica]